MTLRGIAVFEKLPLETFVQAVDFVNVLEEGEAITDAAVAAIDRSDETDVSATVLSGAPAVNGTTVQYTVQAGEPEQRFLISVSVTTDAGNVYEQWVEMRIPKKLL